MPSCPDVDHDVWGFSVGLLRRNRTRTGTLRAGTSADLEHLRDFIRSRSGVEAFLEPRTAVTDTTVLLVAASGEWTRRRVPDPEAAATLARKHRIPLYEAARVGYPQRMREWTAREKARQNAGSTKPTS
jgi:hypothetical protein